jgi:iron complex transport system substrate-binding protein
VNGDREVQHRRTATATVTTTDPTRIVSLAPSATATVVEIGSDDRLVGVTAHCNADAPTLGGWLDTDPERVAEANPDIVLTADGLQRDLRDDLQEHDLPVHHVEPSTLGETLDSIQSVAAAVGAEAAGEKLVADCRARIDHIRQQTPDSADDRPVVYCEEWHDPPMAAGNWVPDAVEAAGGQYPFVESGDRSAEVSAERVADGDPDHAVVHHCGHGERADPEILADRGWTLDAEVHVFDDDLLNQPSPRLVDGIETLAERLHGVEPLDR